MAGRRGGEGLEGGHGARGGGRAADESEGGEKECGEGVP